MNVEESDWLSIDTHQQQIASFIHKPTLADWKFLVFLSSGGAGEMNLIVLRTTRLLPTK